MYRARGIRNRTVDIVATARTRLGLAPIDIIFFFFFFEKYFTTLVVNVANNAIRLSSSRTLSIECVKIFI